MAELERTFIAIKPDGVQRGLIGEIIKRFEVKGFKLVGMKMLQVIQIFFTKKIVMHYLYDYLQVKDLERAAFMSAQLIHGLVST